MNIVEIFKSWAISLRPDERQNKLASGRMLICDSCEYKRTEPIIYCHKCGCPLEKKVFSPLENRCPLGKWEEVDKPFFN